MNEKKVDNTYTMKKFFYNSALYGVIACSIVIGLGIVAFSWRYLELYEVSVRAQSVEANIMMERHQIVMSQMKADHFAQQAVNEKDKKKMMAAMKDSLADMPDEINLPKTAEEK